MISFFMFIGLWLAFALAAAINEMDHIRMWQHFFAACITVVGIGDGLGLLYGPQFTETGILAFWLPLLVHASAGFALAWLLAHLLYGADGCQARVFAATIFICYLLSGVLTHWALDGMSGPMSDLQAELEGEPKLYSLATVPTLTPS